ncbi:MAG: antitoxin [Dehalococcoidia bacterium]|nr:antitoxin [Dehalococcoidia bacterium]
MRVTLALDDDIAQTLRQRAQLLGLSFEQAVNDALRRGLSSEPPVNRAVFRVAPLPGRFQPGIDSLRFNQLNDELAVQEFSGQGEGRSSRT